MVVGVKGSGMCGLWEKGGLGRVRTTYSIYENDLSLDTSRVLISQLPPRNASEGIKSAKLSPYMADRYLKAEAANNNGFTILPYFAAAVVSIKNLPLLAQHLITSWTVEYSYSYSERAERQ